MAVKKLAPWLLVLSAVIMPVLNLGQAQADLSQLDTDALYRNWANWVPDNGSGGNAGNGSGGCSSPLLPKINDPGAFASSIDNYIKAAVPGSPLIGAGSNFVKAGVDNGINPAWIVSIAEHESSYGTAGIATQGTNNPFGLTATASQPNVSVNGRLWYKFPSFIESPLHEGEYLKSQYIDKGLTGFAAIIHKYAPASDGNNESAYLGAVTTAINKIIQAAGTSVDCSAANSGLPSGDVATLVDSILNNKNITLTDNAIKDLKDTASTGKPLDRNIIRVVAGIGSAGFKIKISVFDTGHGGNGLHTLGRAVDVYQIGAQPFAGFDTPITSADPSHAALLKWLSQNLPPGKAGASGVAPGKGELGLPNSTYTAVANSLGMPPGYAIFLDRPELTGATGPHYHIGVPE